jgi:hypothetical protein
VRLVDRNQTSKKVSIVDMTELLRIFVFFMLLFNTKHGGHPMRESRAEELEAFLKLKDGRFDHMQGM